MQIRISLARQDDAALIAHMSRTLIEHGLPWSWTERRVQRAIMQEETAVVVARSARRLAGFAIMEFYDEHAHLNLLAVRPGYRGQGVGAALVQWLEACARTAGIFQVRLEMRSANDNARRFYESLGYAESGMRKSYYAGVEDARCMSHDLRVLRAPRA